MVPGRVITNQNPAGRVGVSVLSSELSTCVCFKSCSVHIFQVFERGFAYVDFARFAFLR